MTTPAARTPKTPGLVLGAGLSFLLSTAAFPAFAQEQPTMSPKAFDSAKQTYFEQCAGCHGVLRKGATGKPLLPEVKTKAADGTETVTGTLKLGQDRLERIIAYGTEGGMNNFDGILTQEQIANLATYIQIDPPKPPEMSLAQMKQTRKVYVEPEDYPTEPLHGRNWENFFVVIERDVGKVAVIDGDTKEVLAHIPTGYAVHVLKASEHHSIDEPENPGRFWYTMGRDGKMTKIDLWQTPDKMLVAEVKIAYDARDVAVSGDGKYVIGGGYWPPHFAIVDAVTMEPKKVVSTRGVNVDPARDDLAGRRQGAGSGLAGRLLRYRQPANRQDRQFQVPA
jgi:nitrite reductase (NO-forming)/hydroxylamine reductase